MPEPTTTTPAGLLGREWRWLTGWAVAASRQEQQERAFLSFRFPDDDRAPTPEELDALLERLNAPDPRAGVNAEAIYDAIHAALTVDPATPEDTLITDPAARVLRAIRPHLWLGGPAPITATCSTCGGPAVWIDCPTGGWWSHHVHPDDGHDAHTDRPDPEYLGDGGEYVTTRTTAADIGLQHLGEHVEVHGGINEGGTGVLRDIHDRTVDGGTCRTITLGRLVEQTGEWAWSWLIFSDDPRAAAASHLYPLTQPVTIGDPKELRC